MKAQKVLTTTDKLRVIINRRLEFKAASAKEMDKKRVLNT